MQNILYIYCVLLFNKYSMLPPPTTQQAQQNIREPRISKRLEVASSTTPPKAGEKKKARRGMKRTSGLGNDDADASAGAKSKKRKTQLAVHTAASVSASASASASASVSAGGKVKVKGKPSRRRGTVEKEAEAVEEEEDDGDGDDEANADSDDAPNDGGRDEHSAIADNSSEHGKVSDDSDSGDELGHGSAHRFGRKSVTRVDPAPRQAEQRGKSPVTQPPRQKLQARKSTMSAAPKPPTLTADGSSGGGSSGSSGGSSSGSSGGSSGSSGGSGVTPRKVSKARPNKKKAAAKKEKEAKAAAKAKANGAGSSSSTSSAAPSPSPPPAPVPTPASGSKVRTKKHARKSAMGRVAPPRPHSQPSLRNVLSDGLDHNNTEGQYDESQVPVKVQKIRRPPVQTSEADTKDQNCSASERLAMNSGSSGSETDADADDEACNDAAESGNEKQKQSKGEAVTAADEIEVAKVVAAAEKKAEDDVECEDEPDKGAGSATDDDGEGDESERFNTQDGMEQLLALSGLTTTADANAQMDVQEEEIVKEKVAEDEQHNQPAPPAAIAYGGGAAAAAAAVPATSDAAAAAPAGTSPLPAGGTAASAPEVYVQESQPTESQGGESPTLLDHESEDERVDDELTARQSAVTTVSKKAHMESLPLADSELGLPAQATQTGITTWDGQGHSGAELDGEGSMLTANNYTEEKNASVDDNGNYEDNASETDADTEENGDENGNDASLAAAPASKPEPEPDPNALEKKEGGEDDDDDDEEETRSHAIASPDPANNRTGAKAATAAGAPGLPTDASSDEIVASSVTPEEKARPLAKRDSLRDSPELTSVAYGTSSLATKPDAPALTTAAVGAGGNDGSKALGVHASLGFKDAAAADDDDDDDDDDGDGDGDAAAGASTAVEAAAAAAFEQPEVTAAADAPPKEQQVEQVAQEEEEEPDESSAVGDNLKPKLHSVVKYLLRQLQDCGRTVDCDIDAITEADALNLDFITTITVSERLSGGHSVQGRKRSADTEVANGPASKKPATAGAATNDETQSYYLD